jgi:glycosyltransferase involved in cell wall biosynthesis
MSRIRLVFYTEAQAFAGGEQVLSHLLNGLSNTSFRTSCVCTSSKAMKELQRRQSRANVDFFHSEARGRPSLWRTVLPLARLLARLGPEILHCNSIDSYAGSYAIFAARLARVPVVVGTIHTAGPHPHDSWADRLFAWSADHALQKAILVSEYSRTPVLRDRYLTPDKLIVIRNGTSLPHSPPKADNLERSSRSAHAVRIGSAGEMIPRKSFSTIIEALNCLGNASGEISLTIYGDGAEREKLEQLARDRNLEDVMDFPGWQDDIYAALSALDIFVLPSLNENAALVLLEAMACGLPVVATNVGAIPEYVADGQTGMLVPAQNPIALAQALQVLIADPEKRAAMGRAGRQRVEKCFTAERMVSETAQLYRQLLARQDRP